jgi:PilZ domain
MGKRIMTKSGAERRKHQRLPLSIPVFVRGIDQEGKEFLEFATALNISAGGILLATRRNLPKSANLSLEIPVAPLPPSTVSPQSVRSLKAKLVRVTHGERCHLLGLRFSKPLGETKTKGKAASAK